MSRSMQRRSIERLSSPVVYFLVVLGLVATSSRGVAQEGSFSDTSSVVVVEVPVRVLRKGQPVRDLVAEDFELFDGKHRVETFGLDVLDFSVGGAATPGEEAEHSEAAVDHHPWYQGRTYLFVYDFALNFNRRMLYGVSNGVRELVGERLGPRDRVAIALFRGHRELLFVLDFTDDRAAILAALQVMDSIVVGDMQATVDTLAVLRAITPPSDPNRAFGVGWGTEPVLLRRARKWTGLEEIPEHPLLLETLALYDYRYASERKLILNFTRALVTVSRTTRNLHGQKHLILFSSGWPGEYLFGDRDDVSTLGVVRRILRAFRQDNWALQGVNTGLWMNQHTASLSHLAYDTGGEVYSNSNSVAELLDTMFERTEVVYLLSYQPPVEWQDGRHHRLRVRLVEDPAGVLETRVVHRPGYRAPRFEPVEER